MKALKGVFVSAISIEVFALFVDINKALVSHDIVSVVGSSIASTISVGAIYFGTSNWKKVMAWK